MTSEATTSSAEVKPVEPPVVEVSSKDDTHDTTSITVNSSVAGTTSSSDALASVEPTPVVPVKPTSVEETTNPMSGEETTSKPVPTEETTKSAPTEHENVTETTSIEETVEPISDNETTSSTPIVETTKPMHTSNLENQEGTKTGEDSTAKTPTLTTSTNDITPTSVSEAIAPPKSDEDEETWVPPSEEPTSTGVSKMPVTTASISESEGSVPSQNPVDEESTAPKNAPVPGTTKTDTAIGSTKVTESSTPTPSESQSEEPVSSKKPVDDDTPSAGINASPTMTDRPSESPATSSEPMSTESKASQTAEPVQFSRTPKLPLNLGGIFPIRVPLTMARDGGLPTATRPTKTPEDDAAVSGTISILPEQIPSPTNNSGGKPTPVIDLGKIISKPIADVTSRASGVFQSATSILGNIASHILENPRPTHGTGRGSRPTATPRPSLDVESPSSDEDAESMATLPISEQPMRTRGTGRGAGHGGRPTPMPTSGDAEVPTSDGTDGTTTELPISKPTRTQRTVRGGSPTRTPVFLDLGILTGIVDSITAALPTVGRPTRTRGASRGGRPTATPSAGGVEAPVSGGADGSITALPLGKPTQTRESGHGRRPTRTPVLPDLGILTRIIGSIGRPTRTREPGRDGKLTTTEGTSGLELPIGDSTIAIPPFITGRPTRTRGTNHGGRPTLTALLPGLELPTDILGSVIAGLPIPGRPTRTHGTDRGGRPTTTALIPKLGLPTGILGSVVAGLPILGKPTRSRGTNHGGIPTPTALFPGLELPIGILSSVTAGLPIPGRPTRSRGTDHGGRSTPTPVVPGVELPVDGILTALPIIEGMPTAAPIIRPGATTGTERPKAVPFPAISIVIPQVPTIPGNILTRLPLPSQGLGDIVTNLPLPPIVTRILGQLPTNVPNLLPVPTLPVQVGPQPPVGQPTLITNPSEPPQHPVIEISIPKLPTLPIVAGHGFPRPTELPTALPVPPRTRPGPVKPPAADMPETPKVGLPQQPAVPQTSENPPISHPTAPVTDGRPPTFEPVLPPANGDSPGVQPAPVTKPPAAKATPGPHQGLEDAKLRQDPGSATAEKPPAAQPNDPTAPEGDQSSQDSQDAPIDEMSESTFKPLEVIAEENPANEVQESSERGPIVAPEATKLEVGSQGSEPTLTKDVSEGYIDVPKTQVLMAAASVKTAAAEETNAPASAPADEPSTKAPVMTSIPTLARLEPSGHTDLTTSVPADAGSEITGSVTATALNSAKTFLATRTHQGLVTAYSKSDAPAAPARTIGAVIGPNGHGVEIVAAGRPVPDIKAALKKQGIDYEAAASASGVRWRGLVGGMLMAMIVVVV